MIRHRPSTSEPAASWIDENTKMAQNAPKPERLPAPIPEPGEYYFEGPNMVFTEAYHRRRGWCCESGCRHCPYGFIKSAAPEPGALGPADGESLA